MKARLGYLEVVFYYKNSQIKTLIISLMSWITIHIDVFPFVTYFLFIWASASEHCEMVDQALETGKVNSSEGG